MEVYPENESKKSGPLRSRQIKKWLQ